MRFEGEPETRQLCHECRWWDELDWVDDPGTCLCAYGGEYESADERRECGAFEWR